MTKAGETDLDALENLSLQDPRWRFWLAALIEGEGCVSLLRGRPGPARNLYRYIVVFVNMTDEDVIRRVQVLAGGHVTPLAKKPKPHHKPSWRWRVGGPRAVSLVQLLLPLMGQRRAARIREVLTVHRADRAVASSRRAATARAKNAVWWTSITSGACPRCSRVVRVHPATWRTIQHRRGAHGGHIVRCPGGFVPEIDRVNGARLTCVRGHELKADGVRCRSCERIRSGWRGKIYRPRACSANAP